MTYPNEPHRDEPSFEPMGTQNTNESVVETGKGEAAAVKDTAVDAGRNVADTARQEAGQVVDEAKYQVRTLVDEGMAEAKTQLSQGHSMLAGKVRELANELDDIVRGNQASGPVSSLVGDLSTRGDSVAQWLETHEPADALDEVRRFAARRPWAFLAVAAGAGLVVGRFARGARELAVDEQQQPRALTSPAYGTDPLTPTGAYVTTPAPDPGLGVPTSGLGTPGAEVRTDDPFGTDQTLRPDLDPNRRDDGGDGWR